ncbi:MAG: MCE family protein [Rhodospirillales bacterium]|nr:MCE family protein [Rhodospirillales bacterium]
MTRTEIREIAIGAIAVVGLALAVGGSYGDGASEAEARIGQYQLFASFNRVDGLRVGDAVLLSGIPIGTVHAMELHSDYRANITLRIDSAVELPTDTAAAIHTDGLFGSKFVTLSPGAEEESLADGDVIAYTQDSLIVSDLLDLIIAQGKSVRGNNETEKRE